MDRKLSRVVGCAATLAIALALMPAQGIAQQPQHYSPKQLRLLMASAAGADDYQKLATYFHYQELTNRTKAQKVIDEYAAQSARYPMATKTVSRAEVAARAYNDYLAKADENEKLALHYDAILVGLGVNPESVSPTLVSLKSLQDAATGITGSTLLEKK